MTKVGKNGIAQGWTCISPGRFDLELILTFLTKFQSFEQALMRTGFTQAGRSPGNACPDWEQFARHVEGEFDS